MKTQNYFIKSIASFVAICFACTSTLQATPAILGTSYERRVTSREILLPSLARQIDIPETLGTIKERFVPDNPSPVIIHIEDAHSSYDGQLRTREILRRLTKEYGLDLIFLEGGFKKIDPTLLRFFKDPLRNQRTANLLAKDNVVGGTELFLLDQSFANTKQKISAFGIENPRLYRKNLRLFRTVTKEENKSGVFLKQLKGDILTAASHVFDPKLKAFFREWLFFEDTQADILRHLETLQKYAEGELNIRFSDARQQLEWPQLVRYFKLKSIEKKIDVQQAQKEQNQLADWAKNQGFAEDYWQGIKSIGQAGKTQFGSLGDSPREFLEKFFDRASPKGFSFTQYPQFSLMAASDLLQHELNAPDLFREVNRLTDRILEKLAHLAGEKRLVSIYQDYLLLKKLFALELTPEEYQRIKTSEAQIKPSVITERFERIAGQGARGKGQEKKTDPLFFEAIAFYKVAKKREKVMLQNMFSRMKQEGKANAILVTGGFHSAGILDTLKENHIAFIQITPHLSENGEDKAYKNVMNLEGDLLTLKSQIASPRITNPLPFLEKILSRSEADYFSGEILNTVLSVQNKFGVNDSFYDELNLSSGFQGHHFDLAPYDAAKIFLRENQPVRYQGQMLGINSKGKPFAWKMTSYTGRSELRNRKVITANGFDRIKPGEGQKNGQLSTSEKDFSEWATQELIRVGMSGELAEPVGKTLVRLQLNSLNRLVEAEVLSEDQLGQVDRLDYNFNVDGFRRKIELEQEKYRAAGLTETQERSLIKILVPYNYFDQLKRRFPDLSHSDIQQALVGYPKKSLAWLESLFSEENLSPIRQKFPDLSDADIRRALLNHPENTLSWLGELFSGEHLDQIRQKFPKISNFDLRRALLDHPQDTLAWLEQNSNGANGTARAELRSSRGYAGDLYLKAQVEEYYLDRHAKVREAADYIFTHVIPQEKLRSAKILDVAAGTGLIAQAAVKHQVGEIVLLDQSPQLLEEAQKRIARLQNESQSPSKVRFLEGDMFDLNSLLTQDGNPEQFDYLIIANTFFYFYDEAQKEFIEIAKRHLKSGGQLIILQRTHDEVIRNVKLKKAEYGVEKAKELMSPYLDLLNKSGYEQTRLIEVNRELDSDWGLELSELEQIVNLNVIVTAVNPLRGRSEVRSGIWQTIKSPAGRMILTLSALGALGVFSLIFFQEKRKTPVSHPASVKLVNPDSKPKTSEEKIKAAAVAQELILKKLQEKRIVMIGEHHYDPHPLLYVDALLQAAAEQKIKVALALEVPSLFTQEELKALPIDKILQRLDQYHEELEKAGKREKGSVFLLGPLIRFLLTMTRQQGIPTFFIDADLRKAAFEDRDKWMAQKLAEIKKQYPDLGILELVGHGHFKDTTELLKKNHAIEIVFRVRPKLSGDEKEPGKTESFELFIPDLPRYLLTYNKEEMTKVGAEAISYIKGKELLDVDRFIDKAILARVNGRIAVLFVIRKKGKLFEEPVKAVVLVYYDPKGKLQTVHEDFKEKEAPLRLLETGFHKMNSIPFYLFDEQEGNIVPKEIFPFQNRSEVRENSSREQIQKIKAKKTRDYSYEDFLILNRVAAEIIKEHSDFKIPDILPSHLLLSSDKGILDLAALASQKKDEASLLLFELLSLAQKILNVEAHREQAKKRKRMYERGLVLVNAALQFEPEHKDLLTDKATLLSHLGSKEQALEIFQKLEDSGYTNGNRGRAIKAGMGHAHLELGRVGYKDLLWALEQKKTGDAYLAWSNGTKELTISEKLILPIVSEYEESLNKRLKPDLSQVARSYTYLASIEMLRADFYLAAAANPGIGQMFKKESSLFALQNAALALSYSLNALRVDNNPHSQNAYENVLQKILETLKAVDPSTVFSSGALGKFENVLNQLEKTFSRDDYAIPKNSQSTVNPIKEKIGEDDKPATLRGKLKLYRELDKTVKMGIVFLIDSEIKEAGRLPYKSWEQIKNKLEKDMIDGSKPYAGIKRNIFKNIWTHLGLDLADLTVLKVYLRSNEKDAESITELAKDELPQEVSQTEILRRLSSGRYYSLGIRIHHKSKRDKKVEPARISDSSQPLKLLKAQQIRTFLEKDSKEVKELEKRHRLIGPWITDEEFAFRLKEDLGRLREEFGMFKKKAEDLLNAQTGKAAKLSKEELAKGQDELKLERFGSNGRGGYWALRNELTRIFDEEEKDIMREIDQRAAPVADAIAKVKDYQDEFGFTWFGPMREDLEEIYQQIQNTKKPRHESYLSENYLEDLLSSAQAVDEQIVPIHTHLQKLRGIKRILVSVEELLKQSAAVILKETRTDLEDELEAVKEDFSDTVLSSDFDAVTAKIERPLEELSSRIKELSEAGKKIQADTEERLSLLERYISGITALQKDFKFLWLDSIRQQLETIRSQIQEVKNPDSEHYLSRTFLDPLWVSVQFLYEQALPVQAHKSELMKTQQNITALKDLTAQLKGKIPQDLAGDLEARPVLMIAGFNRVLSSVEMDATIRKTTEDIQGVTNTINYYSGLLTRYQESVKQLAGIEKAWKELKISEALQQTLAPATPFRWIRMLIRALQIKWDIFINELRKTKMEKALEKAKIGLQDLRKLEDLTGEKMEGILTDVSRAERWIEKIKVRHPTHPVNFRLPKPDEPVYEEFQTLQTFYERFENSSKLTDQNKEYLEQIYQTALMMWNDAKRVNAPDIYFGTVQEYIRKMAVPFLNEPDEEKLVQKMNSVTLKLLMGFVAVAWSYYQNYAKSPTAVKTQAFAEVERSLRTVLNRFKFGRVEFFPFPELGIQIESTDSLTAPLEKQLKQGAAIINQSQWLDRHPETFKSVPLLRVPMADMQKSSPREVAVSLISRAKVQSLQDLPRTHVIEDFEHEEAFKNQAVLRDYPSLFKSDKFLPSLWMLSLESWLVQIQFNFEVIRHKDVIRLDRNEIGKIEKGIISMRKQFETVWEDRNHLNQGLNPEGKEWLQDLKVRYDRWSKEWDEFQLRLGPENSVEIPGLGEMDISSVQNFVNSLNSIFREKKVLSQWTASYSIYDSKNKIMISGPGAGIREFKITDIEGVKAFFKKYWNPSVARAEVRTNPEDSKKPEEPKTLTLEEIKKIRNIQRRIIKEIGKQLTANSRIKDALRLSPHFKSEIESSLIQFVSEPDTAPYGMEQYIQFFNHSFHPSEEAFQELQEKLKYLDQTLKGMIDSALEFEDKKQTLPAISPWVRIAAYLKSKKIEESRIDKTTLREILPLLLKSAEKSEFSTAEGQFAAPLLRSLKNENVEAEAYLNLDTQLKQKNSLKEYLQEIIQSLNVPSNVQSEKPEDNTSRSELRGIHDIRKNMDFDRVVWFMEGFIKKNFETLPEEHFLIHAGAGEGRVQFVALGWFSALFSRKPRVTFDKERKFIKVYLYPERSMEESKNDVSEILKLLDQILEPLHPTTEEIDAYHSKQEEEKKISSLTEKESSVPKSSSDGKKPKRELQGPIASAVDERVRVLAQRTQIYLVKTHEQIRQNKSVETLGFSNPEQMGRFTVLLDQLKVPLDAYFDLSHPYNEKHPESSVYGHKERLLVQVQEIFEQGFRHFKESLDTSRLLSFSSDEEDRDPIAQFDELVGELLNALKQSLELGARQEETTQAQVYAVDLLQKRIANINSEIRLVDDELFERIVGELQPLIDQVHDLKDLETVKKSLVISEKTPRDSLLRAIAIYLNDRIHELEFERQLTHSQPWEIRLPINRAFAWGIANKYLDALDSIEDAELNAHLKPGIEELKTLLPALESDATPETIFLSLYKLWNLMRQKIQKSEKLVLLLHVSLMGLNLKMIASLVSVSLRKVEESPKLSLGFKALKSLADVLEVYIKEEYLVHVLNSSAEPYAIDSKQKIMATLDAFENTLNEDIAKIMGKDNWLILKLQLLVKTLRFLASDIDTVDIPLAFKNLRQGMANVGVQFESEQIPNLELNAKPSDQFAFRNKEGDTFVFDLFYMSTEDRRSEFELSRGAQDASYFKNYHYSIIVRKWTRQLKQFTPLFTVGFESIGLTSFKGVQINSENYYFTLPKLPQKLAIDQENNFYVITSLKEFLALNQKLPLMKLFLTPQEAKEISAKVIDFSSSAYSRSEVRGLINQEKEIETNLKVMVERVADEAAEFPLSQAGQIYVDGQSILKNIQRARRKFVETSGQLAVSNGLDSKAFAILKSLQDSREKVLRKAKWFLRHYAPILEKRVYSVRNAPAHKWTTVTLKESEAAVEKFNIGSDITVRLRSIYSIYNRDLLKLEVVVPQGMWVEDAEKKSKPDQNENVFMLKSREGRNVIIRRGKELIAVISPIKLDIKSQKPKEASADLMINRPIHWAVVSSRSEVREHSFTTPIPTSESESILEKTHIHGGRKINNKPLSINDFRIGGVSPKYKIIVEGNEPWYVSQPFNIKNGRAAIIAYVKMNGNYVARTYYRSNSQGLWRYLPLVSINGNNVIDHYSKGFGQDSITLPYQSQIAINSVLGKNAPLTIEDEKLRDLIFAGTTREPSKWGEGTYEGKMDKQAIKLNPILEDLPAPQKVVFKNPSDEPDFDHLVDEFSIKTSLYEEVSVRVFDSKSGEFRFLFMQDKKGRAWIGSVEKLGPINPLGLRNEWVDGGPLTTPAYEYQIESGGYGNLDDSTGLYVDMWKKYLSKVPVIQEFHRRFVAVKVKEETPEEKIAKLGLLARQVKEKREQFGRERKAIFATDGTILPSVKEDDILKETKIQLVELRNLIEKVFSLKEVIPSDISFPQKWFDNLSAGIARIHHVINSEIERRGKKEFLKDLRPLIESLKGWAEAHSAQGWNQSKILQILRGALLSLDMKEGDTIPDFRSLQLYWDFSKQEPVLGQQIEALGIDDLILAKDYFEYLVQAEKYPTAKGEGPLKLSGIQLQVRVEGNKIEIYQKENGQPLIFKRTMADGEEIMLGRSKASDVDLEDYFRKKGDVIDKSHPFSSVSQSHAALKYEKGNWYLADLGSRNGTRGFSGQPYLPEQGWQLLVPALEVAPKAGAEPPAKAVPLPGPVPTPALAPAAADKAMSKDLFGAQAIREEIARLNQQRLKIVESKQPAQEETLWKLKLAMDRLRAQLRDLWVIGIGDTHADLEGLKEITQASHFIDAQGEWKAGKNILVQVGDFIDRGPDSKGNDDFLRELQMKGRHAGGDVIRLLGNHEMMLLRGILGDEEEIGNWFLNLMPHLKGEEREEFFKGGSDLRGMLKTHPKYGPLIQNMLKDIERGDLQAAFVVQGKIFTHAGITPGLMHQLESEIALKLGLDPSQGSEKITDEQIVEYINFLFRNGFKTNDFSHAVFNDKAAAENKNESLGIFWTRESLDKKREQVYGHTPESSITVQGENGRLINLDVKIVKGGRAYLDIRKNEEKNQVEVLAFNKNKKEEEWPAQGDLLGKHPIEEVEQASQEIQKGWIEAFLSIQAPPQEEPAPPAVKAPKTVKPVRKNLPVVTLNDEDVRNAFVHLMQSALQGIPKNLEKAPLEVIKNLLNLAKMIYWYYQAMGKNEFPTEILPFFFNIRTSIRQMRSKDPEILAALQEIEQPLGSVNPAGGNKVQEALSQAMIALGEIGLAKIHSVPPDREQGLERMTRILEDYGQVPALFLFLEPFLRAIENHISLESVVNFHSQKLQEITAFLDQADLSQLPAQDYLRTVVAIVLWYGQDKVPAELVSSIALIKDRFEEFVKGGRKKKLKVIDIAPIEPHEIPDMSMTGGLGDNLLDEIEILQDIMVTKRNIEAKAQLLRKQTDQKDWSSAKNSLIGYLSSIDRKITRRNEGKGEGLRFQSDLARFMIFALQKEFPQSKELERMLPLKDKLAGFSQEIVRFAVEDHLADSSEQLFPSAEVYDQWVLNELVRHNVVEQQKIFDRKDTSKEYPELVKLAPILVNLFMQRVTISKLEIQPGKIEYWIYLDAGSGETVQKINWSEATKGIISDDTSQENRAKKEVIYRTFKAWEIENRPLNYPFIEDSQAIEKFKGEITNPFGFKLIGSEKSSNAQILTVLHLIKLLPESLLKNSQLVHNLRGGINLSAPRDQGARIGHRDDKKGVLGIQPTIFSNRTLIETFFHEFGHFVEDKHLEPGSPLMELLSQLEGNRYAIPAIGFDAQTRRSYIASLTEFFAETFMHYILHGEVMRNGFITQDGLSLTGDPSKTKIWKKIYDYFRTEVFVGVEYRVNNERLEPIAPIAPSKEFHSFIMLPTKKDEPLSTFDITINSQGQIAISEVKAENDADGKMISAEIIKTVLPATEIPVGGEIIIGRGHDAKVQLPYPMLSRKHVRIFRNNQGFFIEDMGSLNGFLIQEGKDWKRISKGDPAVTLNGPAPRSEVRLEASRQAVQTVAALGGKPEILSIQFMNRQWLHDLIPDVDSALSSALLEEIRRATQISLSAYISVLLSGKEMQSSLTGNPFALIADISELNPDFTGKFMQERQAHFIIRDERLTQSFQDERVRQRNSRFLEKNFSGHVHRLEASSLSDILTRYLGAQAASVALSSENQMEAFKELEKAGVKLRFNKKEIQAAGIDIDIAIYAIPLIKVLGEATRKQVPDILSKFNLHPDEKGEVAIGLQFLIALASLYAQHKAELQTEVSA